MSVSSGTGKTVLGDDYTVYTLLCQCGSPDCSLSMGVQYDPDVRVGYVAISGKLWHVPDEGDFLWDRVKMAVRVLLGKDIKVGAAIVIHDLDHMHGIIGALLEAKRKMQGKPIPKAGKYAPSHNKV